MRHPLEVRPFVYSHTVLFPCGCQLRIESDEDPDAPDLGVFPCGALDCPTLHLLRQVRLTVETCDGAHHLSPSLRGVP